MRVGPGKYSKPFALTFLTTPRYWPLWNARGTGLFSLWRAHAFSKNDGTAHCDLACVRGCDLYRAGFSSKGTHAFFVGMGGEDFPIKTFNKH